MKTDRAEDVPPPGRERVFQGLGVAPGIALGTAWVSDDTAPSTPEYLIEADGLEAESQRLKDAVALATKQLKKLKVKSQSLPPAAAEELGYTFFPCVLVGLSRAPQFLTQPQPQGLWANQVDAVIIPASACGGSGLMSFAKSGTKIITVAENHTRMNVPPETLQIQSIAVNSYLEAIGVITIDRAGMSLDSFYPQIDRLTELK